jgi:quercetin dioxygenase-like cupin family protein
MPGDAVSEDAVSGDAMVVLPAPATTKAAADRFTGDVWVDGITGGAGPGTATLATVRFAPGARTAWHVHENGQTLHVTEGRGFVQTRDGTTITMHSGDTVYTPPGVWHWHGAAPDHFMSHLGLSLAGGVVEWGEHVSDDEYTTATTGGTTERSAR